MTYQYEDVTKMKTNPLKVTNVILYVLTLAEDCKTTLTSEEIIHILFGADDAHLAAYGRPVTFDNYQAYPQGPVGIVANSLLQSTKNWMIDDNGIVTRLPTSMPKLDRLSQSDKDQLQASYDCVKAFTIEETREQNRSHTAWQVASHYRGEDEHPDMDWYNFSPPGNVIAETLGTSYYID